MKPEKEGGVANLFWKLWSITIKQLFIESGKKQAQISYIRNTVTQGCFKFSTGLFASGEPFDPDKLNLDNIFINLEDQLVHRLSGQPWL